MFYIYRITNLINGKTYIGQHKYKVLNDSYMGSGKRLIKAQKKYGIENFKKDILVFNISKKEHIDLLEKTFIVSEREKVGVEDCYNLADGGEGGFDGGPHYEEWKRKISEAEKGKKLSEETKRRISNSLKWHSVSEETRKKLSESNKGKKLSEETRKKMSESKKGKPTWNKGKPAWNKGKHCSEELKKKMSEAHKGQIPWNKDKRLASQTDMLAEDWDVIDPVTFADEIHFR